MLKTDKQKSRAAGTVIYLLDRVSKEFSSLSMAGFMRRFLVRATPAACLCCRGGANLPFEPSLRRMAEATRRLPEVWSGAGTVLRMRLRFPESAFAFCSANPLWPCLLRQIFSFFGLSNLENPKKTVLDNMEGKFHRMLSMRHGGKHGKYIPRQC